MKKTILFSTFFLSLMLTGCASTKVDIVGEVQNTRLCQTTEQKLSGLVLWGPAWRPNQKDVALREAAVQRGLEAFFESSACFSRVEIRRLSANQLALPQTNADILAMATSSISPPDRVVLVRVRELGPVVRLLGSPSIVEGGTEVILDLVVLDVHTGASLANLQTHWQNGGALVIKGVDGLDKDLGAALRAAMMPDRAAQ